MTTITVATLNLHGRQHRWRERKRLVVAELVDTLPDLVSLQEIRLRGRQGAWLRNQINVRLGDSAKHYRLLQQRRRHLFKGFFEGVGILSRLPILSHDAINLGYQGRVALRANVALPSGQTLDFVATHLHSAAHDREAREEQVMALVGWLNDTGRAPAQIVGGDFNEIPSGPAIKYMKQSYRSVFVATRGYEPLATFPTALVEQHDGWSGCLDYIFISPGVRACDARLFCRTAADDDSTLYPSDHVGLWAKLEVEP